MWIKEVQHLRGAAILAVIMIHTTAYFTYFSEINGVMAAAAGIDVFSHVAIPLIVFASGFALSVSYRSPVEKSSFYKRRLATVIPPYIIFSAFCIMAIWWWDGILPSPEVIAYQFLTGSAFYHLWFIPFIVQLYLLFPWLIGVYDRRLSSKKFRTLLPIVFAIQVAYTIAVVCLLPVTVHPNGNYLAGVLFVGFFAYFVAGIYVGRNLESFRRWAKSQNLILYALLAVALTAMITAIMLLGIQEYGSYSRISTSYLIPIELLEPPLYLSIFLILFRWAGRTRSKITEMFGRYSLWAFLTQSIFIFLEVELLNRFGIAFDSWFFYPIVFGSTCCLCLISIFILRRIPYNQLLGAPSSRELKKEKDSGSQTVREP